MIVLQSSSTGTEEKNKTKYKVNKITINMLYIASGKGTVNAVLVMSWSGLGHKGALHKHTGQIFSCLDIYRGLSFKLPFAGS